MNCAIQKSGPTSRAICRKPRPQPHHRPQKFLMLTANYIVDRTFCDRTAPLGVSKIAVTILFENCTERIRCRFSLALEKNNDNLRQIRCRRTYFVTRYQKTKSYLRRQFSTALATSQPQRTALPGMVQGITDASLPVDWVLLGSKAYTYIYCFSSKIWHLCTASTLEKRLWHSNKASAGVGQRLQQEHRCTERNTD